MAKKKKDRQRCFVIMPIGKTTRIHTATYWRDHFNKVLKPLIEENPSLEAYRSKALRGNILMEIITALVTAPIVVADLTDHNCNVYWELGARQSFKHGTVTIAEEGTELPFDVGGKGTLFYTPKNHIKMEDFKKDFREAINDCLSNPERPDSHVLETLSGRGTLFEIFRRDEAIRRLDAVLYECKRNSMIIRDIVTSCEKYKKSEGKSGMITHHLSASAIELLITNRYVDENEEFFKTADTYKSFLISINEGIHRWHLIQSKQEATEWLLKATELSVQWFTEIKAKIEATRVKLGSLL